jgi:uncharacterized phage protein (TIGR01671 family)
MIQRVESTYWNINGEVTDSFGDFLDNDRFVLSQFTGLKDKNGKEIYEGDVVKGPTWKEPHVLRTQTDAVGEVKYIDNHGFTWCGKLPNGYRTYPLLKECEVIGNIYENPKLLSV